MARSSCGGSGPPPAGRQGFASGMRAGIVSAPFKQGQWEVTGLSVARNDSGLRGPEQSPAREAGAASERAPRPRRENTPRTGQMHIGQTKCADRRCRRIKTANRRIYFVQSPYWACLRSTSRPPSDDDDAGKRRPPVASPGGRIHLTERVHLETLPPRVMRTCRIAGIPGPCPV